MGIYIFKRTVAGSTTSFTYRQFLQLKTNDTDLGVLGLDYAITGNTLYNLQLAVRDYIRVSELRLEIKIS